jgi:iron(III) transport system ATP-binding protein
MRKSFVGQNTRLDAVSDLSLSIASGTFFTLLGPSGCGKSTTLRCVAGLETPDAGTIKIDGVTVFSSEEGIALPTNKRDIGMVFQSYAIWPHMTVFENVAYPLKIKGLRGQALRDRVEKALDAVGLHGLEDRPAPKLSGGQQQRVSLARALVKEPKALLLDEPLSNLDAKLREQMRLEIKQVQAKLGITTLYVTHDQTEALSISDCIAVMSGGHIVDMAEPREIYFRPRSQFAADFVGLSNMVKGTLKERQGDISRLDTPLGRFHCATSPQAEIGSEFTLFFRPEDVQVSNDRPHSDVNVFEGKVKALVFLGEIVDCHITIGEQVIRARLHPKTRVQRDQHVFIEASPQAAIAIASTDAA